MKKFYQLSLMAAFLLSACGSDNSTKPEKNEADTETKTDVDVKGMNTAADELTQKTEKLKALKPYTIEEMKDMLPANFNGADQSNYNAASTTIYTFVSAKYKTDNKTDLTVQLIDCAGESGANYYSTVYWAGMNYHQESEDEYTKTVDFLNGRAIEHYSKKQNNSSLSYIANDRLLVVLQGRNMSPEELKEAGKNISLKK